LIPLWTLPSAEPRAGLHSKSVIIKRLYHCTRHGNLIFKCVNSSKRNLAITKELSLKVNFLKTQKASVINKFSQMKECERHVVEQHLINIKKYVKIKCIFKFKFRAKNIAKD
jgi:hypothetical protein